IMLLTGEELLRRFLLHVLPKGLMRVRHYGFLANRCRARRLPEIRAALAAPPPTVAAQNEEAGERVPFDGYPCPTCRAGRLRVIARLSPPRRDRGGGATLRA
ncbi:transposase, partial [Thioalkalicoccus limnaeus]